MTNEKHHDNEASFDDTGLEELIEKASAAAAIAAAQADEDTKKPKGTGG